MGLVSRPVPSLRDERSNAATPTREVRMPTVFVAFVLKSRVQILFMLQLNAIMDTFLCVDALTFYDTAPIPTRDQGQKQ